MSDTQIQGLAPGEDLQKILAEGGKVVAFDYAISLLIITFRRSSDPILVRPGENALVKGLPYTLLTLVGGWWGIPWGPIYSITSIVKNLSGGRVLRG